MRILIVEDHLDMASLIVDRLVHSGYIADRVGTLAEAREAVSAFAYPVILLDRRLPDGDGASFIPEVKSVRPNTHVLLVSALRTLDERVNGLDAGADDYLVKPFEFDELLARIRASLRRSTGTAIPPAMVGRLTFDFITHEAFVAGKPFLASRRELLLLETLTRRAGRAVRPSTVMAEIYGADEDVQPNALKMLVSRLRSRLNEAQAGVEIRSARGVGYMIAEHHA
jgi:two-component system, OmpR family, response regulator